MVNVSALLVSRRCSKNLLGPMDIFSLPQWPAQWNVASVKLLRTAWTREPLDQQWILSRSLAAKEVFRTLQSLIMQLILISTAITRGSGLNFSLIFLHFICWYKYWMQAATSARWLGLDSPVQKSNYTIQNLTHVGLVSVNIAFHNSRKTPLFPTYI